MNEPPRPRLHRETEELSGLDGPDYPYEAALYAALLATVQALEGVASQPLRLAWLGPVTASAARLMHQHALLGAWRTLPFDPRDASLGLPQPPGPCIDVLVLGFALSGAGAEAGKVLGYALRTLRHPERSARVVLLERTQAPLEEFAREVQARLHPGEKKRPPETPAVSMPQRLAWHAAWSPYTVEDLTWLAHAHGIHIDNPQPIGNGRRYLVATARPLLQVQRGS